MGQTRTRTRGRLLPRAAPALLLALVPIGYVGPSGAGVGLEAASALSSAKTPVLKLKPTGGGVKELDLRLAPRLRVPTEHGRRTPSLRTTGFSMVGVTWTGSHAPSRILVRWREGGRFRGWHQIPLQTDLPGAAEQGKRSGTQPVWTGRHRDLQVAVVGTARRLRLTLMSTGPKQDVDAPSIVDGRRTTPRIKPWRYWTRAPYPKLYSRKQWGADPSWRNGTVRYNHVEKQIHIHHTATSNSYTRGDVPGILRGIYRYHTHSLGWFDIGYNFLIDKFGRIWVGRSGGPRKLVRGAHTLGFNQSSVGVAMIGNYQNQPPPKVAITKLVRLAAWKLDAYHRRATAKIKVWSSGSDKYRRGRAVWLPVIDGHRDTNDTECPGTALYNMLPEIRKRVWAREQQFNK
ncbi:peptidoglycan recognition protein [Nocardioides sp. KR10-350]|uniref:peptidoglycan recognition protein family protein n=1 Tax=Nocardioides cheoyonin TaxID=3156615 RepID=UPI0032B57952